MVRRFRQLCSAAFGVFATSLVALSFPAQDARMADAQVKFLDPKGQPLPAGSVIVRDSRGQVITPTSLPNGSFAFADIGPKVTFEFARKGRTASEVQGRGGHARAAAPRAHPRVTPSEPMKNPVFELVLERAPLVFVTLVVDADTGRIKSVSQKPYHPKTNPRGKIRRTPRGQSLRAPPSNDNCADALPIFDGTTAFSTVDATTDGPAHPSDCAFDGQTYEDIWYEYVATCTGTLTVSTCGSADYDTDLVVYDGTDCSVLVRLGCNDDGGVCPGFTSLLNVPVVAGNPYLIRIGGFGAGDEGSGTVTCTCSLPPSNDECALAATVTCGSSTTFSNAAATTSPGDPAFSCGFGGPGQGAGTLWFQFVATDTTAELDTNLSTGAEDTQLAVYAGSCGGLVELACSEDEGLGLLSELCVDGLTVGDTYFVQVASFPGTTPGDITLSLACPGPCVPTPGDECSDAQVLACNGSATFDNSGASTDPLDPAFSCAFNGPDQGVGTVWYSFMATATSARIDTNGSLASDTLLAVYDGSCGAFTELACDDDDGEGLLSELCVSGLTIGNTYHVQVASFDQASVGEVSLNLTCPCPAGLANDECTGAFDLGPLPASEVFDTTEATDDIGAPCGLPGGPFNNVWYRLTGTGTRITATTCNGGTLHPDTQISVYCLDCAAPVCVTGNDDDLDCLDGQGDPTFQSTVSWCSQAGASYLITVGGFAPDDVGVVQLDVFDDGLACTPDVSCLPKGACCLEDGTCVTTTPGDCAALGGAYRGDGSACEENVVADGGFEAGVFAGTWAESSTNFGTPICDAGCGFGGGTGPRTGGFWAWFGGIAAFEESSLEQTVTIPTNASTLDFFLEIPVASENGTDFLEILIDGLQVYLALESDGPTVGYARVTIPLSAFADGGAHALEFHSITTGDDGLGGPAVSSFFVDDVSIESAILACRQSFTLDFESDDFGTPLVNGQSISTPPEFGNRVSVSSAGANAGAAIFDSTPGGPNASSPDPDLLVGLGNLLILQNSEARRQTVPGIFDHPDDDRDGGLLVFTFFQPVEPASLVLVDIDVGALQGSVVTLTDVAGRTRVYTVPSMWTEDVFQNGPPGWRTLDLTSLDPQPGFQSTATAGEMTGFDPAGVVQIQVQLGSSGAVDGLLFRQ